VIVKSGALAGQALVLDIKDHERALVWTDGRLDSVRGPGLYAVWTLFHEVRVELIDARPVRFEHPELAKVLAAEGGTLLLESATVASGWTALVFVNGRLAESLPPGLHAFWRGEGDLRIVQFDLREQSVDISGQEIMTADKVTLRMNAVVTYRIADPVKAITEVEGYAQALGIEVRTVGLRDVILPGEMREILNRVTEARKAAEAALITRREETAAIRSQANTARLYESNPTLMRLRELEVLERVTEKANLSVVLGDGGLADRVVKLL
jgi:hypothetical protein